MTNISIETRAAYRIIRDYLKLHPVKREQTGERNLEFSAWLREHCRPSRKGCNLQGIELGAFVVFDLDFILYDYKRNVMQLLEAKTRHGKADFSQQQTFAALDKALKTSSSELRYLGLHYLCLDNTTPSNSKKITWDETTVTLEECWRHINMLDYLERSAA